MQVLEKTIPWWRKALKFALGGIRSGFGFFPRPARLEPVAAPMFSGDHKEIPEEERALTKAFPKIEMTAPTIPLNVKAEYVRVAEPKPAAEREKEKTEAAREIPEETSGAKAHADSVGVMRGLKPPSLSGSSFSAVSETEVAVKAGAVSDVVVAHEAEPDSPAMVDAVAEIEVAVESEPEQIPVPATEPEAVSEQNSEQGEVKELTNEAGGVPVDEAEVVVEVEAAQEDVSELVVEIDALEEAAPEPVEEAAQPVEVPETNDTPEVVDVPPSEAFKEPAPGADAVQEALLELTEKEAGQEAIPAPELISTSEPAVEISPEIEPVEALAPETAAAPESAPEPVVEATNGPDATPPLVLTVQPSAEEKADAKADERAAAKLAARQKRLDESSEQSPFSVFVGQVYDGPLDLLLDLIRKQDIDIYDIPIARITAQFLAYVNQLKAGDVDVAGEFIYTASLLIHIKSKMLLPRAPTGPEDVAEDPRRELVERLLEHERFKNAAQMLQQKQMLEAATWSNPGVREFKDDEGAEPEIAADTVDLVRIFRDILERARNRPVLNVEEDSVTVGQMIQFLARRLTMEDKPVALRRLLSHTRSERALIAMFLALLEMVRLQAILLRQDRQFSEIFIKKHSGFDAVMNEGLGNARDDWR
ncbi:MAG: segregation/condensation protein A [Terracidiphilus sp.]